MNPDSETCAHRVTRAEWWRGLYCLECLAHLSEERDEAGGVIAPMSRLDLEPRLARLYFTDGRVEMARRPYRNHWKIMERPNEPSVLHRASAPVIVAPIERTFLRRRYAYSGSFVGPWRDDDWFESTHPIWRE